MKSSVSSAARSKQAAAGISMANRHQQNEIENGRQSAVSTTRAHARTHVHARTRTHARTHTAHCTRTAHTVDVLSCEPNRNNLRASLLLTIAVYISDIVFFASVVVTTIMNARICLVYTLPVTTTAAAVGDAATLWLAYRYLSILTYTVAACLPPPDAVASYASPSARGRSRMCYSRRLRSTAA